MLPDGKRYIPEAALLARRAPQVSIGKDATYGMGLEVDTTYGVPVVHHGGSMIGYNSDMMWLPEHGVGAVILTNSDPAARSCGPFRRKLLEVLFDGKRRGRGRRRGARPRPCASGWPPSASCSSCRADGRGAAKLAARYAQRRAGRHRG